MSKTYHVVKSGVVITNCEGKRVGVKVGTDVEIKLRAEEKQYLKTGAIKDPLSKVEYSEPRGEILGKTPAVQPEPESDTWAIDPVSVEAVALAEDLDITVEEVETKIQEVTERHGLTPILAIRHIREHCGDKTLPIVESSPGKIEVGSRVIAVYENDLRKGVVHSLRKNGVVCVTLDNDSQKYHQFDQGIVELDNSEG